MGGGGNGATSIGPRAPSLGTAGTPNTGGGGGGCSEGISPRQGQSGGSGIVIIRAPKAAGPRWSLSPGTNTKTTAPNGDVVANFTVPGTLTIL